MPYDWYQVLTDENLGNLEQGDFIPLCPLVIPPTQIEAGQTPEVDIKETDTIVLSQSCDLANSKIENVLVCPYYSLMVFTEGLPGERTKKNINRAISNLRQGNLPGYHLLERCTEVEHLSDYQVVDFRNVYAVNLSYLKNLLKDINPRVRLLPPYREHLSQAFARFFMRVGLPQDIVIDDKDINKYMSK